MIKIKVHYYRQSIRKRVTSKSYVRKQVNMLSEECNYEKSVTENIVMNILLYYVTKNM